MEYLLILLERMWTLEEMGEDLELVELAIIHELEDLKNAME